MKLANILSDKRRRFVIVYTLLGGILIIFFSTVILFVKGNINFNALLDTDIISAYGTFIGGLVGTLFTLIATLLIYMTYNSQKEELKKNYINSRRAECYIKKTTSYIRCSAV